MVLTLNDPISGKSYHLCFPVSPSYFQSFKCCSLFHNPLPAPHHPFSSPSPFWLHPSTIDFTQWILSHLIPSALNLTLNDSHYHFRYMTFQHFWPLCLCLSPSSFFPLPSPSWLHLPFRSLSTCSYYPRATVSQHQHSNSPIRLILLIIYHSASVHLSPPAPSIYRLLSLSIQS